MRRREPASRRRLVAGRGRGEGQREVDPARRRRRQAAEGSHEGRLAGTARADEREHPAGLDVEVDIVDRRGRPALGAEATRAVLDRDVARRDDDASRVDGARGAAGALGPDGETQVDGPGSSTPGTQIPSATRRFPWVSSTTVGASSAMTAPPASRTTSRSTRSAQPVSRCSTTTSVRLRRRVDVVDEVADRPGRRGVEHRGRLVEQEHARLHHESPASASRWDSPPLSVVGALRASS